MEKRNGCLRMLTCEVDIALSSMRFCVDADFFEDTPRVDVDFLFNGQKNYAFLKIPGYMWT